MTDKNILLPEGIYDLLPPAAEKRAKLIQQMLERFAKGGYEQVNPPLVEFEDSLLRGRGAALAKQTLRIMDPISRRMLAFRPDMTYQVARIASTQMAHAPRPLKLCYAGTTLLASSDPLMPGRQKTQAGIEIFGSNTPESDAEVIRAAVEALQCAVSGKVSIDLTLPGLVDAVIDETGIEPNKKSQVQDGIAHKDTHCLSILPEPQSALLAQLLEIAGNANKALQILKSLSLPDSCLPQIDHLCQVVEKLDGYNITIDPVEIRGFEYHNLLSFSLFSRNCPHELGRGGRYKLENGEDAVGGTLYIDTLLAGE